MRIAERLPLREAWRAHDLLEQRRVIAKVLLLPGRCSSPVSVGRFTVVKTGAPVRSPPDENPTR